MTLAGAPARWLRCARRRPRAAVRLVCLPPAGAGAGFYRLWADDLPPGVEPWTVQYPGREDRVAEPCVPDMAGLADAVAGALRVLTDRPLALFGHSVGGALAYEVTGRLERANPGTVRALFVSARPAPAFQRARRTAVHLRDDDGLAEELAVLGGTDAGVLAHPELRALVLPVIRNDFRLLETYDPAPAGPLDLPLVALTGDADLRMEVAHAAAWAAETARSFRLAVFGGGHFYVVPHRRDVIATVLQTLDEEVPTVTPEMLPHDLTADGVRDAVAAVLELTPDQVRADANLLELGVDSIKLMMLASRWQAHGVEVPFGELAAEPTVEAWARLLREGERCGS